MQFAHRVGLFFRRPQVQCKQFVSAAKRIYVRQKPRDRVSEATLGSSHLSLISYHRSAAAAALEDAEPFEEASVRVAPCIGRVSCLYKGEMANHSQIFGRSLAARIYPRDSN